MDLDLRNFKKYSVFYLDLTLTLGIGLVEFGLGFELNWICLPFW